MANQQLSAALPENNALRVVVTPYDSNASYPASQPPTAAPCLEIVADEFSLFHSFYWVKNGANTWAIPAGLSYGFN
jgi:hypothetical protein